jgi:hypothetical protein
MLRHDTQHNGIQHNDTHHKGLIHDVQHNTVIMLNATMLSVAFFVMLRVVMLSVVALYAYYDRKWCLQSEAPNCGVSLE